jgi:hypothetical protein
LDFQVRFTPEGVIMKLLIVFMIFQFLGCTAYVCIPKQDYKVVLINSREIFKNYKATIYIQKEFDTIVNHAENIAKKVKSENNEFKYNYMLQYLFAKQGIIIKANELFTKEIIDTMNYCINAYSKTNKFDFVIDSKDTTIVYADDKIKILNGKSDVFKYGICCLDKFDNKTDDLVNILNSNYTGYMSKYNNSVDSLKNLITEYAK